MTIPTILMKRIIELMQDKAHQKSQVLLWPSQLKENLNHKTL